MASSIARSGTTSTSADASRMIASGISPISRTAMPSAMVGAADRDRLRRRGAAPSRRRLPTSTPKTAMPGCSARGGDRAAGQQAAAADRDDQRVEIGRVLQQFQRQRALAGDHRRIVVGMDEHQAFVARPAHGHARRLRPGCRRAAPHCAPQAAVRVTLVAGVNFGITMVAAMPSRLAWRATAWAWLPADMAMTPRAALRGGQQGEAVGGAALLEGAGGLQIVELQHHLGAGRARDRVAAAAPACAARGRRCARPPPRHRRASIIAGDACRGQHGIAAQPNRTPRIS